MQPKPVSASAITHQIIDISPGDLTPQGTLVRGKLMQFVDQVAVSVAKRHAERPCVTLGIDSVRFLNSAQMGDLIVCKASVNKTWDASLEIGVKVVAEDFRSLEQKDIFSAYFTFLAVDEEHKPIDIPPVFPETAEERKRFQAAEKRRQLRIVLTGDAPGCLI
jgi:acyl-CoA hydrolase